MRGKQLRKLIEKIARVVWARRSFGVILNREGGKVFTSDPFDGIVVKINVRHLDIRMLTNFLGVNREAMILSGYFYAIVQSINYWLVNTAMTKTQFVGF